MKKNTIDDLGRVNIPKELLEKLGYRKGFKFEFDLEAQELNLIMVEETNYKSVRLLDELNRITMPIELRRQAGFETGDIIKFKINGVKLVLSKVS